MKTSIKTIIAREYMILLKCISLSILLIVALYIYSENMTWHGGARIIRGDYSIFLAWYAVLVYPYLFWGFIRMTRWSRRVIKASESTDRKQHKSDTKPAIYGGKGTSINDLAIVNCSSPKKAYSIIYDFISEHHGKKEEDWNECACLIKADNTGNSNIREIVVELKNGEKISYFFDVSRSMKLAKMMADIMMSKQKDDS